MISPKKIQAQLHISLSRIFAEKKMLQFFRKTTYKRTCPELLHFLQVSTVSIFVPEFLTQANRISIRPSSACTLLTKTFSEIELPTLSTVMRAKTEHWTHKAKINTGKTNKRTTCYNFFLDFIQSTWLRSWTFPIKQTSHAFFSGKIWNIQKLWQKNIFFSSRNMSLNILHNHPFTNQLKNSLPINSPFIIPALRLDS